MSESKPIFDKPNSPVQLARWFNEKIDEYIAGVPNRSYVLLLANLILGLQYRTTVMYCDDTYLLPLPPTTFENNPREPFGSPQDYSLAINVLRNSVDYFVECDEIPDNARGYWHTRLMQLLQSLSDDHITKN